TKVYTKTGDDGTTSLSNGERLPKDHPRIVVLGALDETNSAIGVVLMERVTEEIKTTLQKVQHTLFDIGGELATPDKELGLVSEDDVASLESAIDELNDSLPPLEEFILPGGSKAAALLHYARSVCRRAEGDLVALSGAEKVLELHLKFINRFSDYLFVAARFQNAQDGGEEEQWKK
ncbi:MAG TPA: cob(I)yrinic acid a,c-diamide adenosyltransferase, partial [Candidatus Marinimicrobia bacterium]|nr:cob(I)yrinic acid a,c-diamide adenosyltransferase [Candidatus Neomarinimicrobiota bacterium]